MTSPSRTGRPWVLPRTVLAALTLGAFAACGDDDPAADGAVDAPRAPFTVRVATWNVYDFFDEHDDPDKEDTVFTPTEVQRKIRDLARVLRAIDADVIGIQEVENEALLARLAAAVPELGYTSWEVRPGFDPRGTNVGYLARVPVTMVSSQVGVRFPGPDGEEHFFTRDALEVFTAPNEEPILVMVVHFRSRVGDGGANRRLAEATQARRILERRIELGTRRALLVGDVNDEPGSAPYQALIADGGLVDLTARLADVDRWTFVFRGTRIQLDYIFASERIADETQQVRILHGPEIDVVSDHNPVYADFLIAP